MEGAEASKVQLGEGEQMAVDYRKEHGGPKFA